MKSITVRTNIVLDNKLVEAGLKVTGLKSRRELVDFALRELLRHKQQQKILSLNDISRPQADAMTIFTSGTGRTAVSTFSNSYGSKREGSAVKRRGTPSKSRKPYMTRKDLVDQKHTVVCSRLARGRRIPPSVSAL